VVSSSINSDELFSKEINVKTCQLLNQRKEIFVLNEMNILKAEPDLRIMMPYGFDTIRTMSEYDKILKDIKSWNELRDLKNKKIFAVDTNSYFSKPSIRTITGLEIPAKIIQRESFSNLNVPENSFLQIK
jgi:iron complex transport system substrate-binding protein